MPDELNYSDDHGYCTLKWNGTSYEGSYTSASAPMDSFSANIHATVAPVLENAKESIIASAPWIVRGPLKMSWSWIVSSLLPILIKISIEAFMGRYGELVATLITATMPYIKSTLSDEIISTLERILVLATTTPKTNK